MSVADITPKTESAKRKNDDEMYEEEEEREMKEEAKEEVKEGNPLERLTRCYRGVCLLSVIGSQTELMNASPTACYDLLKQFQPVHLSGYVCVIRASWPWPPYGQRYRSKRCW